MKTFIQLLKESDKYDWNLNDDHYEVSKYGRFLKSKHEDTTKEIGKIILTPEQLPTFGNSDKRKTLKKFVYYINNDSSPRTGVLKGHPKDYTMPDAPLVEIEPGIWKIKDDWWKSYK